MPLIDGHFRIIKDERPIIHQDRLGSELYNIHSFDKGDILARLCNDGRAVYVHIVPQMQSGRPCTGLELSGIGKRSLHLDNTGRGQWSAGRPDSGREDPS